jgi:hypothetical protein
MESDRLAYRAHARCNPGAQALGVGKRDRGGCERQRRVTGQSLALVAPYHGEWGFALYGQID